MLRKREWVFLSLSCTASRFSEKQVISSPQRKRVGQGRDHMIQVRNIILGERDVCQGSKRRLNEFLSSHEGQVGMEWHPRPVLEALYFLQDRVVLGAEEESANVGVNQMGFGMMDLGSGGQVKPKNWESINRVFGDGDVWSPRKFVIVCATQISP